MNTVRKWKISTYLFAAVAAASLYRGASASEASIDTPSVRDSSFQKRMGSLGRLRIPAGIAGVDERQLLRDLAAATSPIKIQLICERLGIFGSDLSVGPLEDLSVRRPDVAGVALMALGSIGSDEATDRLINIVGAGMSRRSSWAVSALGKSKNMRAESQLIAWAHEAPRTIRLAAIVALGDVGGDDALEVLEQLSLSEDRALLGRVVAAAGAMATPEATALMLQIADQGTRQIRLEVLYALPASLDGQQQEWVMGIVAGGDSECAAVAAEALGRAKAGDAVPLLIDVAGKGQTRTRIGAIRALANIGGPQASAALNALLGASDRQVAYEVGAALVATGDSGRAIFLKAMKNKHPMRRHMVHLLGQLDGPEVKALRLDIAHNGSPEERDVVLSQLAGSDEALDLMLDIAKKGARNSRSNALYLLSQSSSPRAVEAMNEIARSGGVTGQEAMRFLGERAGSDPEAYDILVAALHSGNRMQSQNAGWALANAGTDAASEALIAAISSDDKVLAESAMSAVGRLGGNPEVVTALADLVRNSGDKNLKNSALHQLINSGAPEAVDLIEEAIRKGDGSADSALYGVMNLDGPKVDRVIDTAMRSESSATRAAIASGLSSRRDSKSVQKLVQLSRDEDSSVKSAAIQAMANVGTTEAMDQIIDLAENGDVDDRSTAISALGYSGDPRATGVVVSALESDDPKIVQSALYSSHSAGTEVDAALLKLAENASTEMHLRQQAVNTMMSRGSSLSDEQIKALQNELGMAQEAGSGLGGHYH